jgi:hypothetical protein
MNIASILRHWFTLAATLVTGWLVATLTLSPEQQAELAKAFSDLMGPLVIIVTLIITAGWRIALAYFAKLFAGKKTVGSGWSPLVIGGAAAGLCIGQPSCSPETQAILKAYPIKACYKRDGIMVCASSKSGLGIEVDQTSHK